MRLHSSNAGGEDSGYFALPRGRSQVRILPPEVVRRCSSVAERLVPESLVPRQIHICVGGEDEGYFVEPWDVIAYPASQGSKIPSSLVPRRATAALAA